MANDRPGLVARLPGPRVPADRAFGNFQWRFVRNGIHTTGVRRYKSAGKRKKTRSIQKL
jgi:hypothetical protein